MVSLTSSRSSTSFLCWEAPKLEAKLESPKRSRGAEPPSLCLDARETSQMLPTAQRSERTTTAWTALDKTAGNARQWGATVENFQASKF